MELSRTGQVLVLGEKEEMIHDLLCSALYINIMAIYGFYTESNVWLNSLYDVDLGRSDMA